MKPRAPSWLRWFNFLVAQWFFVRLAAIVERDGKVSGWVWLRGVVPMTGWWSGYRFWSLNRNGTTDAD